MRIKAPLAKNSSNWYVFLSDGETYSTADNCYIVIAADELQEEGLNFEGSVAGAKAFGCKAFELDELLERAAACGLLREILQGR
jgi:hypothetical protein